MPETKENAPVMPPAPQLERAPASASTRYMLRQLSELQSRQISELAAVASESDGRPLSEGWELDLGTAEWVRPIRSVPRAPENID